MTTSRTFFSPGVSNESSLAITSSGSRETVNLSDARALPSVPALPRRPDGDETKDGVISLASSKVISVASSAREEIMAAKALVIKKKKEMVALELEEAQLDVQLLSLKSQSSAKSAMSLDSADQGPPAVVDGYKSAIDTVRWYD